MRRPSPDFTTACATMNATTTSSTLALAKPENACAGVIVPVRTTVCDGDHRRRQEREGADEHARDGGGEDREQMPRRARVRPAGTGVNQMPMAIAKGAARFRSNPGAIMAARFLRLVGGRTRPLRPTARPWIEPSSASITNCQENS